MRSDATRARRARFLRGAAFGSVLVCASLLGWSCGRIESARQLNAQNDLHFAMVTIAEFRASHGRLPETAELAGLIPKDVLVDPWGDKLVYVPIRDGNVEHYVVLSLGSDRKLDVPSPRAYIGSPSRSVAGKFDSDIVVVDGEYVRNAGK